MHDYYPSRKRGFTLIETLLAIGVLTVLLTGFMMVFGPAVAGIRKALNVEEVDRIASTLEQEMVTLRSGSAAPTLKTGFAKAFEWILKSNSATDAILVYQYRGKLDSLRADGTPTPCPVIKGLLPGKDYVVQTMVRRKSEVANFTADLPAIEGGIYFVKCTQLVFSTVTTTPGLILGTIGTIKDPKGTTTYTAPDGTPPYPEAVVAFAADFYTLPAKSSAYFSTNFNSLFNNASPTGSKKPVFTRNLAVRR